MPGTACFRFLYLSASRFPGINQQNICQFNLVMTGTFPVGYTLLNFFADFPAPFRAVFAGLLPAFSPAHQIFWTVAQPPFTSGISPFISPLVPLASPVKLFTNGACFILHSTRTDRHGIARIHWPFLIESDYNGSRVSASCRSRLAPLLNFFKNGFTIAGVHFQPGVYSRALNTVFPCVDARINDVMMWSQKRRPRWNKPDGLFNIP